MKKQVHIFFTALMFYTRVPCPKNIDHNPDYLNKASRYFPLIGWIVGAIAFGVYAAASWLWNAEIGMVLSMIASVLVTGAFHEDGFADVCDGFGGGWTKTKILTIMKDSAIGAYGAIGLVLLFLLKYMSLVTLAKDDSLLTNYHSLFTLFLVFITGHSLSRLAAISIVFTHEYSREDALRVKAKPLRNSILGKKFWALCFLGYYLCWF